MARTPPSTVLNLRLPKTLKERLEHHAKQMNITPSELGRRAVAVMVDYLNQKEKPQ